MRPIRIGIVGAGENTKLRHIPGLQAIEGVEIVSVVNRRRESSERVATEFGIPNVYDFWEELVCAADTDAIVIGTWPYLHCPVTLATLAAGKHVMTEARLAMNASEAKAMLEASLQHPELVAQVVPSPFSLPIDKALKRLLDEGFIGKLLAIEILATSGEFLDSQAPMHWRQDIELSGLNIMTLGIWYEAIMRWVGEATKVHAHGKVFVQNRKDSRTGESKEVKVPEHLVVTAEMVCDAMATFQISQITGAMAMNEARLFGTEATLLFRDGELLGCKAGNTEFSRIPIPAGEAGGWRVEEEFINAIRGIEEITHTTFEDGVKYMKFTEAVHQSMREERTIAISSI
jgi:predicted dehydrogenase